MAEYNRDLFRRSLPREHGFESLRIEGELPRDLVGTLYRNGPGLFEQFGKPYAHPFDGDGVISAVRLRDGRAWGAARVVESTGLARERAAGKLLYGSAAPWWRRMRNAHIGPDKITANTNVVHWQGQLLALNEGGGPVALDPHDLRTLGEVNLGGVLRSALSAHPHRIAQRRASYNVGMEYGPNTRMHIYELPDYGPARWLHALAFDEAPLVHDFAATATHLIFFVAPARLRMSRHLLQIGDFGDLFAWRPEHGTEVIVMPLDAPSECVRWTVDPFFQWHFANAFHSGSELVVDYVRFPDLSPIAALGSDQPNSPFLQAQYHRARVDPTARRMRSERVGDFSCEFPRVHPEIEGNEHRTTWLTRSDLRTLIRLDPATGKYVQQELPARHWGSEPVFAPRSGAKPGDEQDGYVLCMVHDEVSDTGYTAIYDAARFEAGPVARVWFDHYVTCTFHGNWLAA